ncbi:GNAT family N-acetyltransferase [Bremerella cremea]|uniref:GNAT family N-acetyltransferase n=1 Tax=Bremerella cremea TaxID=1031537 RepID=A0A368KRP3_9BACT|nr:GNAT family N-acetyltransferase [Bremerella cremea]RCS50516.1 GNAT family N-acetyltransferase [Bremerella cremea]
MANIAIRKAQREEYSALWQLFHDTIHKVNCRDYSPDQLAVWAPDKIEMSRWIDRIEKVNPWVAVAGEQLVGFADLQADGLVDMFFVHHQWQTQGIGKRLFQTINQQAKRLGLFELYSHVSITARPFFEAQGFQVETPQDVTMSGVVLRNYVMRKTLLLEPRH